MQADPHPALVATPRTSASVQGAWTIADQAVVSLTSFAATVIVGRTLGKEALGVYALGPFLFWLLAGVANALVWVPYTARACRLSRPERESYLTHNTLLVVAMGVGLALFALLSGVASTLVAPQQTWLAPFCFAMAPLSFVFLLREHVRRVCIADFQSSRLLLLDLPIGVFSVGTLLMLAHFDMLTPVVALLTTALAAALCLPVVWRLASRSGVSTKEFSRDAASNWGFGRWMLVVAVAWLIGDGSLRWMLLELHGMDELGVFSAAFAVVMLANPLILAMTSFARSWAARVQAADGCAALLSHTLWLTLASVVLAVGALFFLSWAGDFLIRTFFGGQFADPRLVMLLAAAICLQAVAIPVDAALTALELGKRMSIASVSQLSVTLVAGMPLVFLFGTTGIAWAMVARTLPVLFISWDALLRACTKDGALHATSPLRI